VTFLLVSQAPLEKLQAYKRRMGWSVPWASAAPSDFNFDLGFSLTEEQAREAVAQMRSGGGRGLEARPRRSSSRTRSRQAPIRSGTSPRAQGSGRSYATRARAWQLWIRRHDEYDSGAPLKR
jgi:predicted dithiol-disulfide oxidoreductase (DUF899 family)